MWYRREDDFKEKLLKPVSNACVNPTEVETVVIDHCKIKIIRDARGIIRKRKDSR